MVSLLISIWINPSLLSFIFVELFSCFFAILEVSSSYSTSNWYNSYTIFKGMLPTKDYSPPIDIYYDFSYETITVFSVISIFSCHSLIIIRSDKSIYIISLDVIYPMLSVVWIRQLWLILYLIKYAIIKCLFAHLIVCL